jgi:hypothetical protein
MNTYQFPLCNYLYITSVNYMLLLRNLILTENNIYMSVDTIYVSSLFLHIRGLHCVPSVMQFESTNIGNDGCD